MPLQCPQDSICEAMSPPNAPDRREGLEGSLLEAAYDILQTADVHEKVSSPPRACVFLQLHTAGPRVKQHNVNPLTWAGLAIKGRCILTLPQLNANSWRMR